MRSIKLFFIFLCISVFSFGQSIKTFDFFGGKTYNNKIVFYRLYFTIENDIVSGYSFTDEQGGNATKSIISGKYIAQSNKIIFSETSKVVTKSTVSFENQCYLNGVLFFKTNNNSTKLTGFFNEENKFGKKCVNGEINILSADVSQEIKEIKEKIAKNKIEIPTEKEKVVKVTPKKVIPGFNTDKKITIKEDEVITVLWSSNSCKLLIWDDAKEDDDQISITFNDKDILSKYTLKNKEKEIEFDIVKKENTLVFTANNNGLIANNTARVDLFDGEIKHEIITKLKMNKSVTIRLIKNK